MQSFPMIAMRLKLCFGTYAQTLKRCTKSGITQVELGRSLLLSICGNESPYYSDASISDLFNGKKNLGQFEARTARAGHRDDISNRFSEHVEPLLDPGKVPLAIAALKAIARSDDSLSPKAMIDPFGALSKRDIAKQTCFEPHSFLSGVLTFVVAETENRGTRDDCHAIGKLFDDGLANEAAAITLIDTQSGVELHSHRIWADGPSSLAVIEGDLFDLTSGQEEGPLKRIAVIPVDVNFTSQVAMHLDDLGIGGISPETIHGKWLLGLIADGLSQPEIDNRISKALRQQDLPGEDLPIGTISAVDLGTTAYYLLAISRIDEVGNAQSSKDDIEVALSRLVDFYDKHGQGYPLYIPLLGTGLSRACLSTKESYETIKGVFTASRQRVHGNVFIVVLPCDWNNLVIDGLEEEHVK